VKRWYTEIFVVNILVGNSSLAKRRLYFNCFKNIHIYLYRVAHEKPARRLVEQRGRRSRTLYRKLNKWKCKVLTGKRRC